MGSYTEPIEWSVIDTIAKAVVTAFKTSDALQLAGVGNDDIIYTPPVSGGRKYPAIWVWLIEAHGNMGDADNNRRWQFHVGLRTVTVSDASIKTAMLQSDMRGLVENALDTCDQMSGMVDRLRSSKWKYLYTNSDVGALCGVEVELEFNIRYTRTNNRITQGD